VIDRTVRDGTAYLVIGSVRGLLSEVPRVLARLDEFAPERTAIGISPDEVEGLRTYFVGTETEPVVPLAPTEAAEVRALTQYGEVRVPNPTYPAILAWGRDRGIPVDPVDPSDDRYAEMFADHIGYTELVRRTLRERRLSKRPPTPSTADEFAVAWGEPPSERGGSARLAESREAHLVAAVRALEGRPSRVAIVVDRERFDGVVAALGSPG